MGSGFQVNEVGQAITEYTRDRSEHARSHAIDSLNTYGVINDPEAQRELTRKLEDSNLIGKLAVAEFDNLNVHLDRTGRRDSQVRRDDLEQITQHARDYAPTTVLAAQAILKDFGNINAKGGFWDGFGCITKEMIEKWSEERANLGGVLDPSVVFNDNSRYHTGYDNDYDAPTESSAGLISNLISRFKAWSEGLSGGGGGGGGIAESAFDRVNPHPRTNADLPAGYAAVNGEPVYMGNDNDAYDAYDNYNYYGHRYRQAMSDADLPGQLAHNPVNRYQFGDRELAQQKNGSLAYTVRSGDTMDRVSRALLRDHLGYEPSEGEVKLLTKRIGERNHMRDVNKIGVDQTVVIPDLWNDSDF